VIRAF